MPIDPNTNLVAEPGTQLVIIDFQAPANTPFGQYTLNFQFSGMPTSIKALFAGKVVAPAAAGGPSYYLPIYPCVTSFAGVPAIPLPLTSLLQLAPFVNATQGCTGRIYDLTGATSAVDVVEFYNPSLDHYFITWVAGREAKLDAGNTPTRWTRTGRAFRVDTTPHATAQVATSAVCRYYIPPATGDSHFFGRGTVECNATGCERTRRSSSRIRVHVHVPAGRGRVPGGNDEGLSRLQQSARRQPPLHDGSAHRDQMVATGWLAEGDGPDFVVMCAPS